MKETLMFLIQQTEERIKLVDTKASIIIAFLGILVTSNGYFQSIVNAFEINVLFCYLVVSLLFTAFVFLILTIRPVKGWKLIWDFKKDLSDEDKKKPVGFWLEFEHQAEIFDICKIKGDKVISELEILFKELSKRRILKYKYYRIALLFIRFTIILMILCLFCILSKTI